MAAVKLTEVPGGARQHLQSFGVGFCEAGSQEELAVGKHSQRAQGVKVDGALGDAEQQHSLVQ